jgi:hypothetical protein
VNRNHLLYSIFIYRHKWRRKKVALYRSLTAFFFTGSVNREITVIKGLRKIRKKYDSECAALVRPDKKTVQF